MRLIDPGVPIQLLRHGIGCAWAPLPAETCPPLLCIAFDWRVSPRPSPHRAVLEAVLDVLRKGREVLERRAQVSAVTHVVLRTLCGGLPRVEGTVVYCARGARRWSGARR